MSLKDEMLKRKFNMGRFANLSYDELLTFIVPKKFYDHITSSEVLEQFIQALNFHFSEENGFIPTKIKFLDFETAEMGRTYVTDFNVSIDVSNDLKEMFNVMKQYQNIYFPYIVFETIIHETVHSFQFKAMIDESISKLPFENKIAVLGQLLSLNKLYAIENNLISNDSKNKELCEKFKLQQMHDEMQMKVNRLYKYGDDPLELAAREITLVECLKLLKLPNLTSADKKFLENNVFMSKLNSKELSENPALNNYNFLNEILESSLFTAVPAISTIRQKLISLIDNKFKEMNMLTIKQYEQMLPLEELHKQFEYLKELVNVEITEREYSVRCERLEKKALKKIEEQKAKLKEQFPYLFPELAKLKNEKLELTPTNYHEDVLRFLQVKQYYANKHKGQN